MGIGVAGAAALNVDTTIGRAARLERAAQAASLPQSPNSRSAHFAQ